MNDTNQNTNPTVDQIVETVLDSNVLGRSANQRQLFVYLMQHDPNIAPSEYEIAATVFNRGDGFDPAIDSVVRTEIYRLRRNLERFNIDSQFLKIEIPPRSLLPVTQLIAPPKQSKFRLSLLVGFAGILVAIIALTFWYLSISKRNSALENAAIDETFRQKISVVTSNLSDDTLTSYLLNQLVTQFSHDISTHNTVWLVKPSEADYRLEFKSKKMVENAENEIFIFVYTTDGYLIYSKPYYLYTNKPSQSIAELSQKIYTEAFNLNGVIVQYHANNIRIDPKRRYLYQCALDALTFTVVDAPNYLGSNLLTCLDPSLTNIPIDKGFIYILQADVFSQIALGNLNLPVQNSAQKAQQSLERAKEYAYRLPNYFSLKIRVELLKNPIDLIKLRETIDNYYSLYTDSNGAAYIIAEIESKYFGNWDRARQLTLQAIGSMSEESHFAQIVLFNHAVMIEDWNEAKKRYPLTSKDTGISTLIPVAHLACNTKDDVLIQKVRKQLAKHQIEDWDAIVTYIKSRHYHKTYEKRLIDAHAISSCNLF